MKAQTRRIQAQRIFPQKLGQDQGGDQESGQSGSGDMQGGPRRPQRAAEIKITRYSARVRKPSYRRFPSQTTSG